MRLDSEERDFLERVRSGQPLGLADRRQDRVRQRCRYWGLAKVVQKPRRWVITESGEMALSATTNQSSRSEG